MRRRGRWGRRRGWAPGTEILALPAVAWPASRYTFVARSSSTQHRGRNHWMVIILRPAEVWDTRAPFGVFLRAHQRVNQRYYALLLASEKLRKECQRSVPYARVKDLLGLDSPNDSASRAYGRLLNSFPATGKQVHVAPLVKDLLPVLGDTEAAITEHAITSYCGLFEQYVQCWALNYLLALLESGVSLDGGAKRLAHAFHPLRRRALPGLPEIIAALPIVRTELLKAPHVFTHYGTGDSVSAPISPNLTAFATILFWRRWRNLLVHNAGIVTSEFETEHRMFWREFRSVYPVIPELVAGTTLHLNQDTFRPFATAHYKAAHHLYELLVRVSEGRRGHALAPNSPVENMAPEEYPSVLPPLLLPGDHAPSLAENCTTRGPAVPDEYR